MIKSKSSIQGISGLVLCGGESKRMGTDKGLIIHEGLPWFLHTGNLLASFGWPVYYSIRSEQWESYRAHVDEHSLIPDDTISEGPLRGVLTALNAINASTVLVVACDMQDLRRDIIEGMIDAFQNYDHDFYAYRDGDMYQPFPALYSRVGLEKMPGAKSLQQVLQKGNTCALMIPDANQFRNYNQLP